MHIHQKATEGSSYITVTPDRYYIWDGNDSVEHLFNGELIDHPSIVNQPDLFEIVDGPVPENTHWLHYQMLGE